MKLLPARTKSEMLADVQEKILSSKIVGHSTVRYETPDAIVTRYHFTDIVRHCHKDGWVVLANGEYYTRNTKERINEEIGQYGLEVESEDGSWWVTTKKGKRYLFYDGITFSLKGKLLSGDRISDLKGRMALKKRIKAYVREVKALPTLPGPNGGDCWHCLMREEKTGKPLGDFVGGTDHLLGHVEEKYIHGSLLCNALEHNGYNPRMMMVYGRNDIARAVRNYLYDKLGFSR